MKNIKLKLLVLMVPLILVSCSRKEKALMHASENTPGKISAQKSRLGSSIGRAIIGGQPVGSLPDENASGSAMILINRGNDFYDFNCSGTILDQNFILTAAHCVLDQNGVVHTTAKLSIGFGNFTDGGFDVRPSVQVIFHEGYDPNLDLLNSPNLAANDIALIKISGLIPNGYTPVTVAEGVLPESFAAGASLEQVGYGLTNATDPESFGFLNVATNILTKVYPDAKAYEVRPTEGTQSSICFGDSGGPDFFNDGVGRYQIGIHVSVASDCSGYSGSLFLPGYILWLRSQGVELSTNFSIPMYRSYNPNADLHFFTASWGEHTNTTSLGWNYEQTQLYVFPSEFTNAIPLFRLYNPNSGEHYYTANAYERDVLSSLGWNYEHPEGYVYPSEIAGSLEIFRLYNNNSGEHFYTSNPLEKNAILAAFPGIWTAHSSVGWGPDNNIDYYSVDWSPTSNAKLTKAKTKIKKSKIIKRKSKGLKKLKSLKNGRTARKARTKKP